MRYESMADMNQKMREKVAPILVAGIREKERTDQNGHVLMDDIWFQSRREADRYKLLLEKLKNKEISDLRIHENVTLRDSMRTPGGGKVRQVRFQADFSYLPGAVRGIHGIRVYEVFHSINDEAMRIADDTGLMIKVMT